MKKRAFLPIAAMVFCLLALTSCGQKQAVPAAQTQEATTAQLPEITIEQMLEANTNEKIFEQFESALISQQYSDREVLIYRTKDFKCHTLGDGYYEARLDGRAYCYENGEYYAAMGCFPMADPLEEQLVLNPDLTQAETLVDVKQDGDQLVLTTQMVPEKVRETMEYYGLAYESGAVITYTYTLDAKTLLFQYSTMVITDGKGNPLTSCKITLTTEAEMPQIIQSLYDRLTAPNQKELTIVLCPGTADEKAYRATAVEGDNILVLLPEGFTTFYTDAECTQVLGRTDGSAFISRSGTLYSVEDIQPYPAEAQCPTCGVWYEAGTTHTCPLAEDMVQCEFCGKWFEAGNVFRNHICVGREMQPYPEEEQCSTCGAWYEAGTTHTCPPTAGMVQCEFCGRWFEAGNVFRNHICVGSEMQPYPEEEQCPTCGAWYELGTTHTCPLASDMVQCEFCGRWFEAGNVFRNHICVGSEMQPYPEEEQCPVCGAWYEAGTTHTCK